MAVDRMAWAAFALAVAFVAKAAEPGIPETLDTRKAAALAATISSWPAGANAMDTARRAGLELDHAQRTVIDAEEVRSLGLRPGDVGVTFYFKWGEFLALNTGCKFSKRHSGMTGFILRGKSWIPEDPLSEYLMTSRCPASLI